MENESNHGKPSGCGGSSQVEFSFYVATTQEREGRWVCSEPNLGFLSTGESHDKALNRMVRIVERYTDWVAENVYGSSIERGDTTVTKRIDQ